MGQTGMADLSKQLEQRAHTVSLCHLPSLSVMR